MEAPPAEEQPGAVPGPGEVANAAVMPLMDARRRLGAGRTGDRTGCESAVQQQRGAHGVPLQGGDLHVRQVQ
jgi:hypothetical protein